VICTLWCGSSHPAGDHRQPMVKCNQSTVPTIEHAVRALRLKIQDVHAGCIAVAEAARAAAGGPHTRPAPDALAALMAARKAQQAASRAEAAVKAATDLRDAARAACEAAERELAALTAAAVQADAELIAIAIEWYERTSDDDDGLSFERWVSDAADAGDQDITNSTELRAASSTPFDNSLHFTMEPVAPIAPAFKPPAPAVTPAVTRTGRSAAVVAAAAAAPLPDDTEYVVPAKVDHEIRKGCWLGGRYM